MGTILSLIFGLFFIGLGIWIGAREMSGTAEGSANYIITAVAVLVIGIAYAIVRYRRMK